MQECENKFIWPGFSDDKNSRIKAQNGAGTKWSRISKGEGHFILFQSSSRTQLTSCGLSKKKQSSLNACKGFYLNKIRYDTGTYDAKLLLEDENGGIYEFVKSWYPVSHVQVVIKGGEIMLAPRSTQSV